MKRAIWAILLLIVCAAPPSVAATEPSAKPAPVEQDLAEAVAMRQDFGFRADTETVVNLFEADDTDYSYGGPLSPSELKNMAERERLQSESDELVEYVTGRPEDFGGLYFEQGNGELELTILVTSATPEESRKRVTELVPEGLPTTIRPVEHTWQALLDAQETVERSRADVGLRTIWPDVKANGLGVVLEPGASERAVRDLTAVPMDVAFGEGLAATACNVRTACTPYRGGIKIESPNMFCTWGFYATAGGAAKYLLTAGHCAKLGQSIKHNGVVVTSSGGVDRDTFDYNEGFGDSDALRAHVAGSVNAVSPFNRIYASTNSRSITARRSTSLQQVGNAVCFAGYATNAERCGVIEQINISDTLTRFDGRTLIVFHQIRMSRVGTSGDSGGPVYNGSTAYGTVTAVDTSHSNHVVYSAIRHVEDELLVTVCTTSAC